MQRPTFNAQLSTFKGENSTGPVAAVHRRRGGYLLLEMLVTLSLFGVFGLLAAQLFRTSFQAATQTPRATESAMRFDAAIKTLRADVFVAVSVEMTQPRTLLIHESGGNAIQWQADGKGELSRKAADQERSWNVGQPIGFRQDGAIVIVRPSADANDELAMTRGGGLSKRGGK
jgi:type II secretory pathway pseudopilin PulG